MTSVNYAAFHPSFWLHHCQVDRVYEAYIQAHPDSEREYEATQKRLETESGEENRYEDPLLPFKHPTTGKQFLPADTFDTVGLGYVYDALPSAGPPQMRELPSFVVFPDVDPLKLDKKSFELHVFLSPTGAAVDAPMDDVEAWFASPAHAGVCGVFGGKGIECENW